MAPRIVTMRSGGSWAISAVSGILCISMLGWATSARADSHARAVRLSLVQGAVEVFVPDGHGWRPALLDSPLIEGERIRTGQDSRAEIQLENNSTIRLVQNSEVDLNQLALSDKGETETTAAMVSGIGFVSIFNKQDGRGFRLMFPGGHAAADADSASFRIDLEPQQVRVQTLEGKVAVDFGDKTYKYEKGNLAFLTAGAPPTLEAKAGDTDTLTQWSEDRDQWYTVATRSGASALGVDSYLGWYGVGTMTGIPPAWGWGGLSYLGYPDCSWALVGVGGYNNWCWNALNGWYTPWGGAPIFYSGNPIYLVPAGPVSVASGGITRPTGSAGSSVNGRRPPPTRPTVSSMVSPSLDTRIASSTSSRVQSAMPIRGTVAANGNGQSYNVQGSANSLNHGPRPIMGNTSQSVATRGSSPGQNAGNNGRFGSATSAYNGGNGAVNRGPNSSSAPSGGAFAGGGTSAARSASSSGGGFSGGGAAGGGGHASSGASSGGGATASGGGGGAASGGASGAHSGH